MFIIYLLLFFIIIYLLLFLLSFVYYFYDYLFVFRYYLFLIIYLSSYFIVFIYLYVFIIYTSIIYLLFVFFILMEGCCFCLFFYCLEGIILIVFDECYWQVWGVSIQVWYRYWYTSLECIYNSFHCCCGSCNVDGCCCTFFSNCFNPFYFRFFFSYKTKFTRYTANSISVLTAV